MGLTIGKESIKLGAKLGGGIVVYVDASGKHGLIAADKDDPISPWNGGAADSTYAWDSGADWELYVNGSAVCTTHLLLVPPQTITLTKGGVANTLTVWSAGLGNTNVINSYTSATHIFNANAVCLNYAGGGYTDWYLPSKGELTKLYIAHTLGIGGFVDSYYWSSTEYHDDTYPSNCAWIQTFYSGYQTNANKSDGSRSVRAVRSF